MTGTGRGTRRRSVATGLLLAPYLIGTLLLVIVPAAATFALSLTRFDTISPPTWRGLDNFSSLAGDRLFLTAVGNSLYFIVLAVPLRVAGALGLALLHRRRRPGVAAHRAGMYLPTVIPEVAYALVWLWVLNPLYGPLNLVLRMFGFDPPAWLVDPGTAKLGFVLMSLFQIGEGFLIMLAALHDVPHELEENAAVDGASRVQVFRFVTLPLIVPWLVLLSIRDVLMSFQYTFTPALLMTRGEPLDVTRFLPLLIFEEAFDNLRFGRASAMMLLLFLACLATLAAAYLLLRRRPTFRHDL
jgi:multiple sugar transport system permease protein